MIIKQRFLLLPLAVLFSLSGLGGCGGGGAERGEMPPIPVTAAKVTRQDTPRYIDAIGNTAALQ